jgi:serine/threonine-protein kinase
MLWEILAGQRLFLGDTDFQTVKKVQAAVVPSISQINKKVPPDLERIINKALARDPATRYQNAHDLGVDLAKFLFKFGVAVSNFEIANLVQGAMRERQRARPQQASIIDKLIEEALLEFTSLTDDAKGEANGGAAPIVDSGGAQVIKPSGKGYENIGSWLDEISMPNRAVAGDDAVRASLPPGLTEGNLAALEDDEPLPPPAPSSKPPPQPVAPRIITPAAPQPAVQVKAPGSSGQMPVVRASQPPPKKGGNGAIIGVVVVLLVVAAGAAAWFTNIIPHH